MKANGGAKAKIKRIYLEKCHENKQLWTLQAFTAVNSSIEENGRLHVNNKALNNPWKQFVSETKENYDRRMMDIPLHGQTLMKGQNYKSNEFSCAKCYVLKKAVHIYIPIVKEVCL